MNDDQEGSGVSVSPVRTDIVSVVPAGAWEVQESVSQETAVPASKTRESKVPDEA